MAEMPVRSRGRVWGRRALVLGLVVLACHQVWRHGHDYVFAENFAVVEPGKIYRGAWQKDWPMRRIVRDCKIKTVVALAHPPSHPLAQGEKALAEELGFRWVHLPIVDLRTEGDQRTVSDLLDEAADILADPANQPVFFHCHHGINRASMAQIAYRTKHCGWTLEKATDEIAQSFGLVAVNRGPDYRSMQTYYKEKVLPYREALARKSGAETVVK